MDIINYISERIILPTSDLIQGQKTSRYLKFVLNSQWFDKLTLENYQNSRLTTLIAHAYKNVPYYRALFDKMGILPSEIRNRSDLEKLPLLTKDIIRENLTNGNIYAGNIPEKRKKQMSSSGSTGEPLFYYTTKEAYSMNIALSLRGWYWMGYRLGDKYVKISQNPRKNPLKILQDKFSRNLYLASNPLTDNNIQFILQELEKYRPKIVRCYPDPLFFIAKYLDKHPAFSVNIKAITTTGNILYPEIRDQIEKSFGCKIFDAYSCEGNSVLFECPSHDCYHSAMEYGITEVIDENGELIKDGIGRLISTDLMNYAQPFIRYDTQDLVEISSVPCVCGRELLRINKIIGRCNDILENSEGRKFIVHNFTGFFQQDNPGLKRSVDQFQIIRRRNLLLFKLVVNSNFDETVTNYIREFWTREFKEPVEIQLVSSIQVTSSGKRKFIINEAYSDQFA